MLFISEYGQILLILACIFGFFMAWGVGANDVANAMGTSVGSGALTVKQAIIIAMIFEFAGAYLAGGEVTATIRKGMIDASVMAGTPELLVFGMLSALLAAGIWLFVASSFGWPVSTTHSIVGAIIGFAAVGIGIDAVVWSKVWAIVASWVISPLLSGTIAYMLIRSVQKFILDSADPLSNAIKYVPVYMFFTGFMIGMVTLVKGLKHIGLHISTGESLFYATIFGIIVAMIGKYLLNRVKPDPLAERDSRFGNVESIFAVLMIFTACAMAFAHGSNDVANAVGPLAAIVGIVNSGGEVLQKSIMPPWILLLGGAGIVFGLITLGFKVMKTVGTKITELTPTRGFAAELSAATTVVLASGVGIPVSTTHTLVGAVLGVGLARGISAINLRVVGSIFLSWLVTLPAGAGLAIIFFFMFKGMFLT
ncbi:MAG: phosphate permease [Gammaproteobacteria bacterium]|nr:MAG: phosphate permease [Gammaproteobacteria bacterium]RKZ71471.1 MAG: phosphate permease [Gammaproteobacteria bacterium]